MHCSAELPADSRLSCPPSGLTRKSDPLLNQHSLTGAGRLTGANNSAKTIHRINKAHGRHPAPHNGANLVGTHFPSRVLAWTPLPSRWRGRPLGPWIQEQQCSEDPSTCLGTRLTEIHKAAVLSLPHPFLVLKHRKCKGREWLGKDML